MARALIVGCGCRGQALAKALRDGGHATRGTTRNPERLAAIESAGAEPVLADPDRLGTLTRQLEGVSVVCWLLGRADGDAEAGTALDGPRLESMLDALVDTPVRGFVYEAGGPDPGLLERGRGIVARAGATYRMPVALITASPEDAAGWLRSATDAVEGVLAG